MECPRSRRLDTIRLHNSLQERSGKTMPNKQSAEGQQKVGIFWLIGDRLILDTSPLSDAEAYGDCLTHRNSHIDFWTAQQRFGAVPSDIEYEEPPRGRVVFNTKTLRFALYADR